MWLFFRGFSIMPSYALWVMPQLFVKWKVSWIYIIVISFISVTFVVVKLSIFQCFRGNAASMKWPFLGPNSLKYCQILLNISTDVVFKETQTVFEDFWKNWNFYRDERYPKSARLVELWLPFSPWRRPKSKKVNISKKTTRKITHVIWVIPAVNSKVLLVLIYSSLTNLGR